MKTHEKALNNFVIFSAYFFLLSQVVSSYFFQIGSGANIFNIVVIFILAPLVVKNIIDSTVKEKINNIFFSVSGILIYVVVYFTLFSNFSFGRS
ncbi:hypothetical protein [Arsukibacterium perlucidum]|uniref:hypothetical protein n=1 Tax=Arsukibacterium perlucidum TaxID=368811 RepID=UPI00037E0F43|nr:hypothetical protein [Arsukibacterium perlucidum]